MARVLVLVSSLFLFPLVPGAHADPSQGTITNPGFAFHFGSAPGTDTFDVSGTLVPASGAPPLNLPTDVSTVSFDGGHFTQTLAANSLTCTATTCTYTITGGSGITSLVVKPTAHTFSVAVRKADLTSTNDTQMGAFSLSIGTNKFTFIPNSPPVGAVTGPTTAAIGTLLTFDATHSTDFNSDPLTFTWSLVSAPKNSAATLSSTNQPTTSLTPDLAGAYVLKAIPNDGKAAGVPALITLQATGGTTPPPPPPGPSNFLITLSSDANSYVAGQTATLTLQVNVQDGNGARRYFYAPTFDDQPVALTTVTNNTTYRFVTSALASGTHTFKVVQYSETTDIANDLNNAIANYNEDILDCNKALQYETNAAVIAKLQAQIAQDQAQITQDQAQLTANRDQLSSPAVLKFSAQ
jgi:hypothetical protein